MVAMLGAAVLNTSVRMIRNERMNSPGPELPG